MICSDKFSACGNHIGSKRNVIGVAEVWILVKICPMELVDRSPPSFVYRSLLLVPKIMPVGQRTLVNKIPQKK